MRLCRTLTLPDLLRPRLPTFTLAPSTTMYPASRYRVLLYLTVRVPAHR